MCSFRVVVMVIPEHVDIRSVCPRVTLMRSIHRGELDRITHEKDGGVVEYEILVSFGSVEFHGESAYVPHDVGKAALATYGRDPDHAGGFLAEAIEEVGRG